MSKRLLALNLVLAATSLVFAVQVVRILSAPGPLTVPSAPAASQMGAALKDEPAPAPGTHAKGVGALAAYGVVATKNLFNPSRSETPAQAASLASAAKPLLYGVVINGNTRLAYLEDPVSKRVFGYKIGDAVAGGQLEQIHEDRVVIRRPEGPMEVKLIDPRKPKPVVSPLASPRAPTLPPGVSPAPSITPPPGVPSPAPQTGPRLPGPLLRRQGGAGASVPSEPGSER